MRCSPLQSHPTKHTIILMLSLTRQSATLSRSLFRSFSSSPARWTKVAVLGAGGA